MSTSVLDRQVVELLDQDFCLGYTPANRVSKTRTHKVSAYENRRAWLEIARVSTWWSDATNAVTEDISDNE